MGVLFVRWLSKARMRCVFVGWCVQDSREAVIWMAVQHKQKKALELFSREIAPAGTGMGMPTMHLSYRNSKICVSAAHVELYVFLCFIQLIDQKYTWWLM